MRGGFQGLKSTRNPLKLPSNIKRGLNAGLTRGIKRKAEDVLKKEITKQAKKALNQKNVKQAVRVATALFLHDLDGFVVIGACLNGEACIRFGN